MVLYKKMKVAERMVTVMSNNRERRRNRMLQHGAACTVQTWYRSFLWQKAELARVRMVREWAASVINSSVRTYREKLQLRRRLMEAREAAKRIQSFFRMLFARTRWGELLRALRAQQREEEKLEKIKRVRLRREREANEELLATQIGAVRRLQQAFQIHKLRKAAREEEARKQRVAEEARKRREAKADHKNIFDALKANVEQAFSAARKIGEDIANGGAKPSPLTEEEKERRKVRGKLSEANERLKRKRIAERQALEVRTCTS